MSRAFVREPDGDEIIDEQPDRPQSPHPNYVTPAGHARLEEALAALLARKGELAAAPGDMAAQETLRHVERDIRYCEGRLERAIPIDPAAQDLDEVGFGAVVGVLDEDDCKHRFEIVGEDEADVAQGKVSWVSPLARALAGAHVGDVVSWERPAGTKELEVIAIAYPGGS